MNIITIIITLVISTALSMGFNWIMLRYARKLTIRNDIESERWAKDIKAGIGGFSFYIMFLIFTSIFHTILPNTLMQQGFVAAASLAFFIGWYDDTFVMRPIFKLIGQFVCAGLLTFTGNYIHACGIYALDIFFSLCWIVAIMNSINMIDNMDAIAGSIGVLILCAALMVMYFTGNFSSLSPYFVICMIGTLLGFLRWNWYPSKIMMGDTGSQFLGILLALISISLFWKFRVLEGRSLQVKQWLFPYIVFLTPFIDTITVVFRRTIRGQGFWNGGRDHITHYLVYFGLTESKVAIIILLNGMLNLCMAGLMLHLLDHWKYWYSILFAMYMAFVFIFIQVIYERAAYNINKNKEA